MLPYSRGFCRLIGGIVDLIVYSGYASRNPLTGGVQPFREFSTHVNEHICIFNLWKRKGLKAIRRRVTERRRPQGGAISPGPFNVEARVQNAVTQLWGQREYPECMAKDDRLV